MVKFKSSVVKEAVYDEIHKQIKRGVSILRNKRINPYKLRGS